MLTSPNAVSPQVSFWGRRLSRSEWLATLLGLGLTVLFGIPPAQATEKLTSEKIKAGLRTTTVEEEGYVDKVLEMVDKGTIPYSLVESTFQWARKKPRYKFQYFKHAMELRIARSL